MSIDWKEMTADEQEQYALIGADLLEEQGTDGEIAANVIRWMVLNQARERVELAKQKQQSGNTVDAELRGECNIVLAYQDGKKILFLDAAEGYTDQYNTPLEAWSNTPISEIRSDVTQIRSDVSSILFDTAEIDERTRRMEVKQTE